MSVILRRMTSRLFCSSLKTIANEKKRNGSKGRRQRGVDFALGELAGVVGGDMPGHPFPETNLCATAGRSGIVGMIFGNASGPVGMAHHLWVRKDFRGPLGLWKNLVNRQRECFQQQDVRWKFSRMQPSMTALVAEIGVKPLGLDVWQCDKLDATPRGSYQFREATPDDLAVQHPFQLFPYGQDIQADGTLREMLRCCPELCLVASQDGRRKGVIVCGCSDLQGMVLYVGAESPEVADALVRASRRRLQHFPWFGKHMPDTWNDFRISVGVRPDDKEAAQFWASLGFHQLNGMELFADRLQ